MAARAGRVESMIELIHYDDSKEKSQSHEVTIIEHDFYNAEVDVWSHNPFDLYGYGETKEEAIEDFRKKFRYIMKELKAFETMLLDTDMMTDNIMEVDRNGLYL